MTVEVYYEQKINIGHWGFITDEILLSAPAEMAELATVLGALSAAGQVAEYTLNFVKLLTRLSSDVKSGLKAISEEIGVLDQFITIARNAQQMPEQMESEKAPLKDCIEDAVGLRNTLATMAKQAQDSKSALFRKSLQRIAKEKNISTLYSNLRAKQMNLHTATNTKMAQKITAIHADFPDLISKPHPARVSAAKSIQTGFSTLTLERTAQFIGRATLLEEMKVKLEVTGEHSRLVLYGLGGIGNAIQLRKRSPEVSIFWINASSMSQFEVDYLKIATTTNLMCNDNTPAKIEDIKCWLNTEAARLWLIVVDDINEESTCSKSESMLTFLSQARGCSVIFTTRSKLVAGKLAIARNTILVNALEPQDAIELLYARASLTESGNNTVDAVELLHALDHLPLAISQAGSFIWINSISISEYLKLFNRGEDSKLELLNDRHSFEHHARSSTIKSINIHPIVTTLEISVRRLEISDTQAAKLLSFMAGLASYSITQDILWSARLFATELDLVRALGTLSSYSLIVVRGNEIFDMHSLVYLSLRNWLRSQKTFRYWSQELLIAVSRAFPSGEPDTLDTCTLYLPHVPVILNDNDNVEYNNASNQKKGEIGRRNQLQISRAELAYRFSRYLVVRAQYDEAEAFIRKAIDWSAYSDDMDSVGALVNRTLLATIIRLQGQYERARCLDEELVERKTRVFGAEHPSSLTSLDNLALSLQEIGRYAEAETSHLLVLGHRTRVLGPEHKDTLATMNNLMFALQNQSKYESAKDIGDKLVKIKTRVLGRDHLETLTSINNLGVVLQQQGDLHQARKNFEIVLKQREKLLGRKHPSTLMVINNIGTILHGQSEFSAAEKLIREALEGNLERLGPRHAESIKGLRDLSMVIFYLGRHEEAEDLCREALDTCEEVWGLQHPGTQICARQLNIIMKMKKETQENNAGSVGPSYGASSAQWRAENASDESASLGRLKLSGYGTTQRLLSSIPAIPKSIQHISTNSDAPEPGKSTGKNP